MLTIVSALLVLLGIYTASTAGENDEQEMGGLLLIVVFGFVFLYRLLH